MMGKGKHVSKGVYGRPEGHDQLLCYVANKRNAQCAAFQRDLRSFLFWAQSRSWTLWPTPHGFCSPESRGLGGE